MNACVLDTSVAIAWYLEESFSRSAREWQTRFLNRRITLIVPLLHYWEFANVLKTLVQRRELNSSLALETYELHLDAPLKIAEPNQKAVLETALEFEASAYDAVYITLCLSRQIPLITAEKTTTAWVRRLRNQIEIVR